MPNDFIVSIDMGGTKQLACVINSSDGIVARLKESTDPQSTERDYIKSIAKITKNVIKSSGVDKENIKAVCLGMAGSVNPYRGTIYLAPNLGLKNFNIKKLLENEITYPVLLENDVNLAALGIKYFEVDKSSKNLLAIFVGTGIGGGLILNGAGKSTLANIISGKVEINSGDRIVGHNTLITNYSQDIADNLNPDLDVLESVYGIAEEKTLGQLRSLLGSFLFTGDDVFKKVGVLSGGEKSRLALAKILLTKSNLILLDEPTNHLDFSSKSVLQKALINFPGSLILVSHDIDFLQPVVNIVTEIRKGKIQTYRGGIEYYLSKREELIAAEQNETDLSRLNNKTKSRKDVKRSEAEERQKKHLLTKDLKKNISEIEKLISDFESKEEDLESQLADSAIYSDPGKARELNEKFIKIKYDLAESMKKWETLSEQLAEIEGQFS